MIPHWPSESFWPMLLWVTLFGMCAANGGAAQEPRCVPIEYVRV